MNAIKKDYWRKNLQIIVSLLLIWFSCSYLCGIVFADYLNQFQFAGFKLGFWFAQQGSIYTFILIIITYTILINRLDKKYHLQDQAKTPPDFNI